MEVLFRIPQKDDRLGKAIAWWDRPSKIRFWEPGKYCHVEIRFSDGMCFSSSERDGGTRFKDIDVNLQYWDIMHIPTTEAQEAFIRNWCTARMDKEYDWPGIFGFVIPIFKQKSHKWYCSEICSRVIFLADLMENKYMQIGPNRMARVLLEKYKMVNCN